MSRTLYIAAKAPRVGACKTRLGRGIGDTAALALYRAFVVDLARRFADAPFPVGWYITPDDGWPDVEPLVGRGARVVAQGEGDWTGRQRRLFRGVASRGEERLVLIGSDSPHVRPALVARAFELLESRDVVFGPTHDGGYYLIGMRGFHDVLEGVPMSTRSVYEQILARASALGVSVGEVETTFDVDEAADLVPLIAACEMRADLSATRGALAALGLLPPQQRLVPPLLSFDAAAG